MGACEGLSGQRGRIRADAKSQIPYCVRAHEGQGF